MRDSRYMTLDNLEARRGQSCISCSGRKSTPFAALFGHSRFWVGAAVRFRLQVLPIFLLLLLDLGAQHSPTTE